MLDFAENRLFVSHLGLALVALHLKLTAQAVYEYVEVQLTHTGDDGLAAVFVGVHTEGRVLFGELGKAIAQLVDVRLRLGLDGDTDHGVGERHALQRDGVTF